MVYGLRSTRKQTEGTGRKRKERRTRLDGLPECGATEGGAQLGETGGDGGAKVSRRRGFSEGGYCSGTE